MDNTRTFQDAFDLLCGNLIGEGIHRKVFECRIRDDLVVKVENDETVWRYFANVQEMNFWGEHQFHEPVARWLAPCEYMSPDGRIMLQKRTVPLRDDELPERLPSFLTDHKKCNFGLLDGNVVCHDYAMTIPASSSRLRKADW